MRNREDYRLAKRQRRAALVAEADETTRKAAAVEAHTYEQCEAGEHLWRVVPMGGGPYVVRECELCGEATATPGVG